MAETVRRLDGHEHPTADALLALHDDFSGAPDALAAVAALGADVGLNDRWSVGDRGDGRGLRLGYVDEDGPVPVMVAEMPLDDLNDVDPEWRDLALSDFVAWTRQRWLDLARLVEDGTAGDRWQRRFSAWWIAAPHVPGPGALAGSWISAAPTRLGALTASSGRENVSACTSALSRSRTSGRSGT